MRTIKATFAIIDRSKKDFPMKIMEIPVAEKILWDYYHKNRGYEQLCTHVRYLAGIKNDARISVAVYADYIINPLTGKVMFGKDAGYAEFIRAVSRKRVDLIKRSKNYKPKYLNV